MTSISKKLTAKKLVEEEGTRGSVKLTAKQMQLFKDSVLLWQRKLWLQRYKVFTTMESMDSVAKAYISEPDQVSVIAINEALVWWDMDETIQKAGLHECLELLLHEITDELEKYCSDNRINTMVHRVIRTLENVLYEE